MDTGTNKRQNNNSNSEAQKKRRVTLTNKQRYDDTLNNAGNIIDSPVDGLDTLNARK
ncbi:15066_t:CDS:1, partial [Gigaspora rosea]